MMANFFATLPEDLHVEILLRLPVKSLLRFRCVCKSWLNLIDTREFIGKHLSTYDHSRSVIVCRSVDGQNSFMSLEGGSRDAVLRRDPAFDLYVNAGLPKDIDLLGCYNGVVCLSTYPLRDDIVFWNPATRQKTRSLRPRIEDPFKVWTLHGFDYDCRTNDYKVVRITCHDRRNDGPFLRAFLYRLSTKSWQSIGPDIERCRFEGYVLSTACVDGMFSVLAIGYIGRNPGKCFMLTFDMKDEVFVSTPLPEASGTDEKCNKRMNVLKPFNGSVALITYFRAPSVKSLDISTLDAYGPEGSWTKIYSIRGPFTSIRYVLGFWKGCLVFENKDEEAITWDLRTRELKKFHVPGECLELFEYRESLVSVS